MYNIRALEPHRAVCISAIINFVIVDRRTHLDCHISTTKRYSTLLLYAYMLKPHDILIYVYIYNRLFNRDTTRRPYFIYGTFHSKTRAIYRIRMCAIPLLK